MKKGILIIIGIILTVFIGYELYKCVEENKEILFTLTINGNNYTNNQTVTCKTKKKISSCNVTLPSVVSNTPFLAYNDIPNTKEVKYDFDDSVTLTGDKTIYVIQEEILTYNLNIDYNGIKELTNNSISCLTSKRFNKCSVTLPSVTRTNGEVIGYSNTKNSHETTYKIGEEIVLTKENTDIYVISKKDITYNFNDYDFITSDSVKCTLYNTETSCKVTLPIATKLGYINQGEYLDNNKKTAKIGESYQLSENTTLKYIYNNRIFNINKSIISNYDLFNKTYIAYDQNCQTSNYYKDYFSKVKAKTPYLFNNAVGLIPLSSNNFDVASNNKYKQSIVGLTNSTIAIYRCSNSWNSIDFLVLIHEMTHIQENAFQTKNHSNLYNGFDLYSLFNKYRSSANNPLRDYAYTNISEFIAELYSYYYLSEVIPTEPYNTDKLPYDLLNASKKLDCIFKNDYNINVC